jgi:2-polyprenyl-3-methyl-5-hydroxy-6-metoxy-1,4-benzoquinol methylase
MNIADQHKAEVDEGNRFAFGKNWANFLSGINEERIALAVKSLSSSLATDSLVGKTFLDVGSGSGLFSLAARRLGAQVFSFDYDSDSVRCTRELRRRYFPDDLDWNVEQGSVLDKDYLGKLGTFDVVYSWGVLHHTGSMWEALANVNPLVPVGGQLFIAIYNDQGEITDKWDTVKRRYNELPTPLAFVYALSIIGREEYPAVVSNLRNGTFNQYVRSWRDYAKISTRGMNRWYDWIDWIGGLPYERATIEEIVDFYSVDGFRLTKTFDCSGYGCNEFVFSRDALSGTVIDTPIKGANTFGRRFGYRVVGPFADVENGLSVSVKALPPLQDGESHFLLSNSRIVSETRLDQPGICVFPSDRTRAADVEGKANFVVAAETIELHGPFTRTWRRNMWQADIPHLASLADYPFGGERVSPVFIFEDGQQLPTPHSMHADIDGLGKGRFAHWGEHIFFSTSDNSDPNTNGRSYRLLLTHAGHQASAAK